MKKLIIVDDEPLTLQYLQKDISSMENCWEVVGTFCDGVEAYEWLLKNETDLIITDIKMPGMTGLELCEKIVDRNPEQYIIIISGHDEFEFAQEAIGYGVRGYLLKPITQEKLEAALEKAYRQLEKASDHSSLPENATTPISESELITKAKEYINKNYKNQISLVGVAAQLGVSANYLSTLFSRELGQSYINYLTALRLDKASEIIRAHPRKKIYEVAEEVGYVSVKHFLHVFKRERGYSPGEYQKQVLDAVTSK